MKKIIFITILVVFLATLGMTLCAEEAAAEEAASGPAITGGANFYWYTFFWNNTDFNQKDYEVDGKFVDGSADNYNYSYGHGDLWMQADWAGSTVYVKVGAWGPFGMQPIFTVPVDQPARLLEGYVDIKELLGPFTLRIGKWRLNYGEGLVAFDGGEDGTTGVQLSAAKEKWSLDLFYRKVQDNGGWNEMAFNSTPHSQNPPGLADWNLWGAYATFNLNKFTLSPYFFYRAFGDDKPFWIGADVKVTPMKELAVKAEFVKMFGKNAGVDYTGYALNTHADFTTAKGLNIGAGYFIASGDDTPDDTKNSLYTTTLENPFTYGSYKGWVGFGPAHMTGTAAGFACLAPWEYLMSNLTVLNFHVAYPIKTVTLRVDFFKYDKHKLVEGYKDLGYEIAGLVTTNIKGIDCGATLGAWIPGDHFIKTLQKGDYPRYGGYFFLSKSFDFKLN